MIARGVLALIASSWVALLAGLAMPQLFWLLGGHLGTDAMTPVFLWPWLLLSLGLLACRSRAQLMVVTLWLAAAVLLVGSLLALLPPVDALNLGAALAAALAAGIHGGLARQVASAARQARLPAGRRSRRAQPPPQGGSGHPQG